MIWNKMENNEYKKTTKSQKSMFLSIKWHDYQRDFKRAIYFKI